MDFSHVDISELSTDIIGTMEEDFDVHELYEYLPPPNGHGSGPQLAPYAHSFYPLINPPSHWASKVAEPDPAMHLSPPFSTSSSSPTSSKCDITTDDIRNGEGRRLARRLAKTDER